MNPIFENRYNSVRYAALWLLFVAVYAAAFGIAAGLPAGVAALDGAVLAIVSGFEVLILWNILKYGIEGIRPGLLRAVYYFAVGMLFVGVSLGAECVTIWAATGLPAKFTATIPARGVLTAAVYAFFALWYWFAAHSDDKTRRNEAGAVSRDSQDRRDGGIGSTGDTSAVREPAERLERVTVRGGQGKIEVIGVGEIIYLEAEGDYVAIVTSSGRHLKEGTMKYFEENLPAGEFLRVHRSYIVSVGHISRIETSGREHTLILRGGANDRGGTRIRISDAGYRLLRQSLGL